MDYIKWRTTMTDDNDNLHYVEIDIDESMWLEFIAWTQQGGQEWVHVHSWDDLLLLHQFNTEEYEKVLTDYSTDIDYFLNDNYRDQLLKEWN